MNALRGNLIFLIGSTRWIQWSVCDRHSTIFVNWLIFDILGGLDFIVWGTIYYTGFSSLHKNKKLDSQKLSFKIGSKFEFDFRHKWIWIWEEYSAEKCPLHPCKECVLSLPYGQSCQRPLFVYIQWYFLQGAVGLRCSVLEYITFLRSHCTYGKPPRGAIEINC